MCVSLTIKLTFRVVLNRFSNITEAHTLGINKYRYLFTFKSTQLFVADFKVQLPCYMFEEEVGSGTM